MGILNIYEIAALLKKHILKIVAVSILIGMITYVVANNIQTYTCTLGFKYNHADAAKGLAPDGESKLNPYEIQNPVVIQGALDALGYNNSKKINVKGIRQNIKISKVVTGLDSEVSKSAALLGEKYEAPATEFEMKFKYKKSLGPEFGPKMFSTIMKQYDKFLLNKYYGKNNVSDFAKIVGDSSADYIDIADMMGNEINSITTMLYDMAESYPKFCSKNTGYYLDEVAGLYDNLRTVQHAKYYGNIRAGNLAKDTEMVIKSYRAKAKELSEDERIKYDIQTFYQNSISSFYDSYKAAGLYRQAEEVQRRTDSSNNRDKEVLYDYDIEKYKNTYDEIVLNYVKNAVSAANSHHTVNYYNSIVSSYENDAVDEATKQRLIKENESVLEEIKVLSSQYAKIANETLEELYESKVSDDLQYLVVPEVTEDIPIKLITGFTVIFSFGLIIILMLFSEFLKRFAKLQEIAYETSGVSAYDKKIINTDDMDELHYHLYNQYQKNFEELFLVYQDMQSIKGSERHHMEAFIRWRNSELGLVSPDKIITGVLELGLFEALNEWIIKTVCNDIAEMQKKEREYPIIHVNCPKSELNGFAINDILLSNITKAKIPFDSICLEISGDDIADSLEEIMLIKKMGVQVCIDRFENSEESNEIIGAVEPDYIKMSIDILKYDMYATTKEDFTNSTLNAVNYIYNITRKCHANNIKVCICGIEDKKQDNLISMYDFDFKQGYFYNKPRQLSL